MERQHGIVEPENGPVDYQQNAPQGYLHLLLGGTFGGVLTHNNAHPINTTAAQAAAQVAAQVAAQAAAAEAIDDLTLSMEGRR